MTTAIESLRTEIEQQSQILERVRQEVGKLVVGQREMVDRLLLALIAGGHLLVEGIPGLAKTTAIKALAAAVDAHFARIQFTPDLLPADLIGTQIYRPGERRFEIKQGPVFANLLLADEINRAPAKVQSALLEAMQERPGDDRRRDASAPGSVPRARHPEPDRAGGHLSAARSAGRPLHAQDQGLLPQARGGGRDHAAHGGAASARAPAGGLARRHPAACARWPTPSTSTTRSRSTSSTWCSRRASRASFRLERLETLIEYGASPRATIYLAQAAKAHAFLQGRAYVTPQDVKTIGPDVLRHRVLLTYEAEAQDLDSDSLLRDIFNTVDVP